MRILIVDDYADFTNQLHEGLKSHFNLVDKSFSLPEAKKKLSDAAYDYIVLDYNLGIDNGLSLFESFKNLNAPPKVIMMTSFSTKDLVIKALNKGVHKFIEKPFHLNSLLELIKAPIEAEKNSILLDHSSFTASYKEEKFKLTEIEFKILNFFIENANKLVTKDELHEYVYSDQVKALNVLNTHFTNLKSKLPIFAEALKTIRKKGYIFDEDSLK